MLGHDVVRAARHINHEVEALDRAALDVTDGEAVTAAVAELRPDAIVNCSAFTNVDGAETETDDAMRVNATGARNVAEAAAGAGAAVVYPSTDYVFDGELTGRPYLESDETNPLSSYGASKLAGEQETAAGNPRHFVVRTSWLFGVAGRNFVSTMLDLGAEQSEVLVVRDQVGSPTYTGHLADGILRLAETEAYGLHHMAAGGECSWYDLAIAIFEKAGLDCRVLSTTTEEFGRPAARPAWSVLDTEWNDAIYLPDWEQGLASYLRELE
jgi:dTDP-4-dehydrorhamnose reductase